MIPDFIEHLHTNSSMDGGVALMGGRVKLVSFVFPLFADRRARKGDFIPFFFPTAGVQPLWLLLVHAGPMPLVVNLPQIRRNRERNTGKFFVPTVPPFVISWTGNPGKEGAALGQLANTVGFLKSCCLK